MAKASLNSAFAGFSGRSGGMVFRQLRGETFISQRPESKQREISAAQQQQRARFIQATAYAKQVLSDPWQRRVYEAVAKERNRRADKIVTSDFLTPPVVEEIDVSEYRRQPGDVIRILATDDVEVVSVTVTLQTASGVLVEQGAAAKTHGVWCYKATVTGPPDALAITATAKDRPGHDGSRTIAYP